MRETARRPLGHTEAAHDGQRTEEHEAASFDPQGGETDLVGAAGAGGYGLSDASHLLQNSQDAAAPGAGAGEEEEEGEELGAEEREDAALANQLTVHTDGVSGNHGPLDSTSLMACARALEAAGMAWSRSAMVTEGFANAEPSRMIDVCTGATDVVGVVQWFEAMVAVGCTPSEVSAFAFFPARFSLSRWWYCTARHLCTLKVGMRAVRHQHF